MGSHQDDVKLCADLHVDLARELGDISTGIAAALRDTDLPLSDRVCTLLFGVVSYCVASC